MARVVILGAGIGGVPMAYELRRALPREIAVCVVSASEWFQFVPSNPWVALGWRKSDDIRIHLPKVFRQQEIAFNASGARRVLPGENAVLLGDGSRLEYDWLVIATGPALAFDEIEGLGPQRNTVSVCDVGHATDAHARWEAFCRDPGPMVVGAVQGASCFGPAYEFAMMAVTELRRRKIRDRVPITFVTSEPYVGHLGLGGVGDTKGMLEAAFRDRDVKWIVNAKIDRIGPDAVEATEISDDGEIRRTHALPSRFTMLIPGFRGQDCLRDGDGKWISGLCNPRGFVLVDRHQRNAAFPNVFAVGVCVAIPPVEQTPVPVGVPKTGFMIESMVAAVAANIAALAAGKPPAHEPTLNAVCLADFGNDGIAFVAQPQIPPRNVNWSSQGYWVHVAKAAFEKYFLHKVRHGTSEPFYERMIMSWLGIERLRQPTQN
ncbi:MAG: NAD(P)/FAD-dependent oxidoreductase [Alphaproteobacteria bacterium]